MFSEIKLVTLGVRDLDRSIAFYAEALGFEEFSRDRVDPDVLAEAWRIPAGIGGRFAVIGSPAVHSGMLRLVEWTPAGDQVWTDPARFEDLGLQAVSFRVRNINAAWDMLSRHGAREKSKPTYWEVEQNIAAWDSKCLDPDGTTLGAFEVVGEIERALGPLAPERDSSEVQIATIHCFDARRCESFYRGLGFEPLHDRMVEHLWHFLGLPAGTKVHKINLIMPGGPPGGRVELIQFVGPQGRSLKTRTVPPARGPLMVSFRVQELGRASRHLQSLGARPIGAARYLSPPFGPVASATFFGPSDEVIELFEAA